MGLYAVTKKMRQKWLEMRENGDTLKEISKEVKYDPRTVAKHLETAQHERDNEEIRKQIKRKALEDHYAEIIVFVDKLISELELKKSLKRDDSDVYWIALQQHMPKARVWPLTTKLEALGSMIVTLAEGLKTKLSENVQLRISNLVTDQSGTDFVLAGVVDVVIDRLLRPNVPLPSFRIIREADETQTILLGKLSVARVNAGSINKAKELVTEVIDNVAGEVKTWTEVEELARSLLDRDGFVNELREALVTIKMRKILPGNCKYCPF